MTSVVDRRRFLLTSLAGVLAPLAAEAQQARKVARVGVMALTPTPELVEAARQGLRDQAGLRAKTSLSTTGMPAGGRICFLNSLRSSSGSRWMSSWR
jgi:hypothetical protein